MTTDTLPNILSRLEGVREVGQHKWQACCPSHDDTTASLSITQATDGTILVHCHAGCQTPDVLSAVDMKLADLFPSNGHVAKSRIVGEYDYRDSDGTLLYQAVRFEPKDFRQCRPDGHGGRVWSVKGLPVIPYRLPELTTADPSQPVLVVEGEKDVDRLRALGLAATCNIGGAGKWRAAHSQHLAGRSVAILPDNDNAGRKHGQQVAQSLVGKAKSVKLVELPGLPDKGDVSDWLDNGGTSEKLMAIVEAASEWRPQPGKKQLAGKLPASNRHVRESIPERHNTDVGNAERFAEQHGADVRYCHPWGKWLVWDGRRWAFDLTGDVMRRAKRTARTIYGEAANETDQLQRQGFAKWAAASEKRERLTAMIALAQSEQPIPIAVESLDSHPWLLNVENGTIELRTGELREHRREDYLTKCCPVELPTEPGIDPVLWLSFLDRVFDGNATLIQFVQRLMGASLVGEVLEHVLPIYFGPGCNGKSVKIETWAGMLGPDYAMKAPPGLLMAHRSDRHPTELADLHGKRLVAAVESEDGGRLSESLVKELTGGDSIRARRMQENFWQFRPSHTVVLATNHKPTIRGTDHGIWRRIRLVPFTVTIPEAEQDKELPNKLQVEWPAILRWTVAGCLDWQRNGLQAPDDVKVATETYRSDSDVLGEFITDCCIVGVDCECRAGDLFEHYKKWADKQGEYIETQTKFGMQISERGYEKTRPSSGLHRGKTIYHGIDIQTECT